jgi:pyrroline-5-carboxylate reductase
MPAQKVYSRSAVVFLGGGRITSALCAGLRLAGYDRPIVVYDRNPEKLGALRRESGVMAARDLKSALERMLMLVLAVRPASVTGMLAEVRASRVAPGLCVSLAAGVPFKRLRAALPGVPWVRAMPSPVCRIARGLTSLSFDRGVGEGDRAHVLDFFGGVGQIVEIPERQFDAFTATFSSSHGYHAVRTLAEQARRAGLDRKTALSAAAHALCDGIQYWRDSDASLDELLHEAATPGGTAAATMAAMDRAGYARVVAKGLAEGIKQARRNARR